MKRSYRVAITSAFVVGMVAAAGIAIAAVPGNPQGTANASTRTSDLQTASGLTNAQRLAMQRNLRRLDARSALLRSRMTLAEMRAQQARSAALLASQSQTQPLTQTSGTSSDTGGTASSTMTGQVSADEPELEPSDDASADSPQAGDNSASLDDHGTAMEQADD